MPGTLPIWVTRPQADMARMIDIAAIAVRGDGERVLSTLDSFRIVGR